MKAGAKRSAATSSWAEPARLDIWSFRPVSMSKREDVGFLLDCVDGALHPAEDVVFGFMMPEAGGFEAGLLEEKLEGGLTEVV